MQLIFETTQMPAWDLFVCRCHYYTSCQHGIAPLVLANATIALKLAASFALAGIEKIKRHEKAKAINFMLVPQLGSKDYILLEARRCAHPFALLRTRGSGHAAAAPPKRMTNSHRLIASPRGQDIIQGQTTTQKGAGRVRQPMSALGQKQTCASQKAMSRFTLTATQKADIARGVASNGGIQFGFVILA
jgi:hypothetical protein